MIKDAAYRSLLKRDRAELHERFVGWAEPINRERGRELEFEEILGYHLEQAYRYRTELGAHRRCSATTSAGARLQSSDRLDDARLVAAMLRPRATSCAAPPSSCRSSSRPGSSC